MLECHEFWAPNLNPHIINKKMTTWRDRLSNAAQGATEFFLQPRFQKTKSVREDEWTGNRAYQYQPYSYMDMALGALSGGKSFLGGINRIGRDAVEWHRYLKTGKFKEPPYPRQVNVRRDNYNYNMEDEMDLREDEEEENYPSSFDSSGMRKVYKFQTWTIDPDLEKTFSKEMKFYKKSAAFVTHGHANYLGQTPDDYGVGFHSLTSITQGISQNQRVGNKINIKYLTIRFTGVKLYDSSAAGIASSQPYSQDIRVIFFLDKWPNGDNIDSPDTPAEYYYPKIFADGVGNSDEINWGRNHSNKYNDRFVILCDKRIQSPTTKQTLTFEWQKLCNYTTQWNSGATYPSRGGLCCIIILGKYNTTTTSTNNMYLGGDATLGVYYKDM